MIRVLADYHHSDLFESLQLLFTDRLGWQVVAPYGMDWFTSEAWNFERKFHGDAVARQYLEGIWGGAEPDANGWVTTPDRTHPGRMLTGITYQAARETDWTYVLSTLPDNDAGLYRLAQDTGARFGIQLGNNGQQSAWDLATFALCSTTLPFTPPVPHVVYRQEFSLADFAPTRPPRDQPFTIRSFVQCLAENPKAHAQFQEFARADGSFGWGIHGSYGSHPEDEFAAGNLPTTPAVARAMAETDVIWHTKEWSDGYGHVIHNAFASGRPVFGIRSYYTDKLAGPLWVDGETCIDIERRSRDEVLDILRRLRADPDEHQRMCDASAARFRQIVDFDAEATKIADLLALVAA